jgi:hypothetical protein
MNKKPLKKKMFVMRETLVDLTPHLLDGVQGADCTYCTQISNWQLSDAGSCNPCIYDKNTQIRTINTN